MNVECRWGPLRFGLTIIFAALHESAIDAVDGSSNGI